MNEDGYTAIPTADYRPYTELPPEERKQVEKFLENNFVLCPLVDKQISYTKREDDNMDKKQMTILDGSIEKQTRVLKEFFGLRPDQTFQDLDVDEDEDEIVLDSDNNKSSERLEQWLQNKESESK